MRQPRSTLRRAVPLITVTVALLGACSDDKAASMTVLGADAKVAGASAGELLRDYVRNFMVTPSADNMLSDPSKCDMGLSTAAVYFAPTFGSPGDSTASCTMGADQVLFLSPVGVYCFEDGTDKADVACLDSQFDLTASGVTIDGKPVDALDSHLVEFEAQDIEVPDGNLLEVPAGKVKTIGRAQVVLVDHVPVGKHEVVLSGDFGNGTFKGALTIALTVA